MSPTAVNYSPYPPTGPTLRSPPTTVVLTVVLLIFFLLGFFSIYFCRCIMDAVCHTWNLRGTPSGHHMGPSRGSDAAIPVVQTGLDPALTKSLPTFLYSTVKDARREKYGLECAICLVEFRDDSLLRLLTVCCHVFHQECVDLWLQSHRTCPVCRRNLESPTPDYHAKLPESPPATTTAGTGRNSGDVAGAPANDVLVDIIDDDDKNPTRVRVWNTEERAAAERGAGERFGRSHSTGHSIVKPTTIVRSSDHEEECDRYTLRLPEHVRMRILRARHWTASCETYGDLERPSRADTAIMV